MDMTLLAAIISVFMISLVFSMFGQGGGSLYTPLLFLLGYAALISISTSLVLNLVTALSATLIYYRSKMVDLKLSSTFVPGICAGSLVGGASAKYIDSDLLMWAFVVFLIVAGGRMVYTYWEKKKESESCLMNLTTRMIALIVVFSFAVGVLSGLLGVGGGIIIVPFLIFLCKHPTKGAAGTAAFVVIFSSVFGVIGHSAVGNLDAGLILTTVVVVFVGAQLGARLMVKSKTEMIKVGFGLIMWLFAVQLVLKLLGYV
ncbi:MAG: sulfite exporter TauE/SafE family protein [Thermoplasmata archaeon]